MFTYLALPLLLIFAISFIIGLLLLGNVFYITIPVLVLFAGWVVVLLPARAKHVDQSKTKA